MTRFSETATLQRLVHDKRPDGSIHVERESREVFVNARTMGASKWAAAASSGLHADHEIELRSSEYQGEPLCVFRGVECDVERVSGAGEFTRLTLARRLSDE